MSLGQESMTPRATPTAAPERVAREALSLKRAAHLLDVHVNTLRRWWKGGRIQLIRVGPKLLRMPRSEVARLRASGDFHIHT